MLVLRFKLLPFQNAISCRNRHQASKERTKNSAANRKGTEMSAKLHSRTERGVRVVQGAEIELQLSKFEVQVGARNALTYSCTCRLSVVVCWHLHFDICILHYGFLSVHLRYTNDQLCPSI